MTKFKINYHLFERVGEIFFIKSKFCFCILCVTIFLTLKSSCHAQKQFVILKGSVVEFKTQSILKNATVLAISNFNENQTTYSASNEQGQYELQLEKGKSYTIQVNFLGYQQLYFLYEALKNETLDLVLKPKINQLSEVVLEYKIPIEIKEDTITYQADAFVNGKERKLRELLKKLPGIEVDRDGNVTAQGKRVTKVLVEDKLFFTGNSKLAVNNIPADAVDKIEVLENYNAIGFLKGIEDSNELAINIKLKENKKKFVFGDAELGGGPEENYLVHPNVFYYSPKTNFNFIGDFNNVGEKSFELEDYIEFNGGFGKLLGDIRGYLSLSSDDFSKFLSNSDFRANVNRFGALNFRQAVTKKTDINSFLIVSDGDTKSTINNLNTFNDSNTFFNEERFNDIASNNSFLLGKFTLDYEPNPKEDLAVNTFVKVNRNNQVNSLLTESPGRTSSFVTNSNLETLDISQNLEYSKRFSRAQTLSVEAKFNYSKNRPTSNWITDQPFLDGFVPLQQDNQIDIIQEQERENFAIDLIGKDYWVLNNFNHVYTTIGIDFLFNSSSTQELQRLTNGTLNNFSSNGFGNKIDYRFTDSFLGFEYKFLSGIFTVRTSLFYHNYLWDNTQSNLPIKNTTSALLPEINVKAKFKTSEKLQFRYRRRLRFPESNRLYKNFTLNAFNRVVLGNPELANERYHTLSLNYYKYSLFRGLNLNVNMVYNKKTQSIKNRTELNGINQFISFVMFNQPENSFKTNFRFSKKFGSIKIGVDASGNYNEFFQLVNESISKNISRSISMEAKGETFFERFPNIELGYRFEPNSFTTSVIDNVFLNREFFGLISYDFLDGFQFKGDFKQISYENRNQGITNTFNLANASLFYQKEDSPWAVELSANNIFDTQFRRQNSISDFLISDETTFIIPRVLLLKIIYKL